MNSYALNEQTIGVGSPDSRVFFSLSTTGWSSTSFVLNGLRYLTGNLLGKASSIFALTGRIKLSGATTGGASGTISTAAYLASYLAMATSGNASTAMNLTALGALTPTSNPFASGDMTLHRGLQLAGAGTGRATMLFGGFVNVVKPDGSTTGRCTAILNRFNYGQPMSGSATGRATSTIDLIGINSFPAPSSRRMSIDVSDRKMKVI